MRGLVHHGHVPFCVELDADVALHPLERVVLANGENHRVAGNGQRLEHLARALTVLFRPLEALELHADELAFFIDEPLGRVVLDDVDQLFLGILELPRAGLEVLAAAARDDLHILGAESLGSAAAIHGRVADADDENLLLYFFDVPEVHAAEPLDADVNHIVRVAFVATGNVELLALGRA